MSLIQVAICKTIEGTPPEIQVIPFGRHETSKGVFTLDEEGMASIIADFEARKNDMVVDYEHQTLGGGEAPAAGWIKRLVSRGRDGLWAVVEWTERAKEYLRNREYRYLSPVFLMTVSNGRAVRLINAALTNQPAIDGMVPLVNKQFQTQKKEEKTMLKKLVALLALKDGTTEEQAVDAVKALAEDSGQLAAMKAVGIDPARATAAASKGEMVMGVAHKDVLSALGLREGATLSEATGTIQAMKAGHEQAGGLGQRVQELEASLKKRDAAELVASAMKEGKVTPAQKGWATAYAEKDPEGFRAFAAKAVPVINPGELAGGGSHESGSGLDAVQAQVNKSLGVSEEVFKKHNPTSRDKEREV